MAHKTPGMVDLGERPESPHMLTTSSAKDRKYYPSMTFPASAHPALSSAKVGQRVTLLADGEIMAINSRQTKDGGDNTDVRVELKIGKLTPDTDENIGAKYCPRCAENYGSKAVFCKECGARLVKRAEEKAEAY